MKISSVEFKEPINGLKCFKKIELGDIVILTGSNGSGKTRMLKTVEKYVSDLKKGFDNNAVQLTIVNNNDSEQRLNSSTACNIEIVNYSHFDANLQSPTKFAPYVIHNAKQILKKCNYEETALNSLLLLYDMVNGYSEEYKDGKQFDKFKTEIAEKFNIKISVDETPNEKRLKLFNQDVDDSALSPGQQYLIRIAVACYQNESNSKMIFFLDEPELHLHPKALIDVINHLRNTFKGNQFWISTHSLALIAYLTANESNATVLNMKDGKPTLFRSDSSELIDGLIGAEDNSLAIQLILSTPDEYASNKFSIECYNSPDTLSAQPNDPQNQMVEQILNPNDIVVDYGAGKGRFFEGLGIDYADEKLSHNIKYYAFDPENKDAERCKWVMNRYGSNEDNYFNDIQPLKCQINGQANYVLLVNVLHEIDPIFWVEIFENIRDLLCETGKLIIVERSELTVGEAPYNNRFLVLTSSSAKKLFNESYLTMTSHIDKPYIEKYTIERNGLHVTAENVKNCLEQIKIDSYDKIKELKNSQKRESNYKKGLKISFWLHQYANSTLNIEDSFKIK